MSMAVVAGLILVGGRLLVCQRSATGAFPLEWEFPGGKVKPGEEKESALARELREELNIHVTKAREVYKHQHAYSAGPLVDLTFFDVVAFTGEPENRVFKDMLWIRPEGLGRFNFLAGDRTLIEEIMRGSLVLGMPQRGDQ